jgi:hypothetical protein
MCCSEKGNIEQNMFLLQERACSGNVLGLKKEKIKYKSVHSAERSRFKESGLLN